MKEKGNTGRKESKIRRTRYIITVTAMPIRSGWVRPSMDEIPPDPRFYFLNFGPINVHGSTSFGGQVAPSGVAPDLLLDQIGGKGVTLYSNRNSRT